MILLYRYTVWCKCSLYTHVRITNTYQLSKNHFIIVASRQSTQSISRIPVLSNLLMISDIFFGSAFNLYLRIVKIRVHWSGFTNDFSEKDCNVKIHISINLYMWAIQTINYVQYCDTSNHFVITIIRWSKENILFMFYFSRYHWFRAFITI